MEDLIGAPGQPGPAGPPGMPVSFIGTILDKHLLDFTK